MKLIHWLRWMWGRNMLHCCECGEPSPERDGFCADDEHRAIWQAFSM